MPGGVKARVSLGRLPVYGFDFERDIRRGILTGRFLWPVNGFGLAGSENLIDSLFCAGRLQALIAMVIVAAMLAWTGRLSAQPTPAEKAEISATIKINPLKKKTRKTTSGPPAISSRYFYMERPRAELKLSYELENERIISQDEESEDSVGEFREGLGFSTKGWLYHPALLAFNLDFDPEWIQTPGGSDYAKNESDSGYLNAYALDMDLLPFKPYTLHFFGRKYQNSFRSAFSERAIIDTDSYGGSLAFKYKVLPTTLSYSNIKTESRGALRSSQEQDWFNLGMINQQANSMTRLSAYFRDSLQTNEGQKNEIKSSNTHLINNYFIQKDLRKTLTSDLVYNWTDNTRGDGSVSFTNSDLRWTEQLYWAHRKNLWTQYNLLFRNQQTDGSTANTGAVGASLSHLLYENLTTKIDGEARRNDYTGGTDDVYSGKLDFDYTRRIPWGALGLSTGLDTELTKRDSGDNEIWAINEPYIATAGGVTFLDQENIDTESIRVTNRTGSILYINNQDYIVEVSGTLVRIRPTLFGNIRDGQELLVSYRYNSGGSYDDILFGRWAGINVFLWSTLRLSYDYYRRTQDVISGTNPNTPIDEAVHRSQARVMWRWTDTTFSYDVYESLLASARTTWRLNEQLTFRPMRSVVLDFSGYLGNTQFTYTDEKEDFYRVSSKISWSPSNWCRTGFEAYQYNITGNVQNDSNAGVLAFADLFYGRWTVNLSYRYLDDSYEDRDYQRSRQGFMVRVSRAFWQ